MPLAAYTRSANLKVHRLYAWKSWLEVRGLWYEQIPPWKWNETAGTGAKLKKMAASGMMGMRLRGFGLAFCQ